METKRCSKCGETKPIDEFYNKPNAKSGKTSWCKNCHNVSNRRWILRNPQKRREISQRYDRKLREFGGNAPQMEGIKICNICGKEKVITEFPVRPSAPDGRRSTCSRCLFARSKRILVNCSKCGIQIEKEKGRVSPSKKYYCSFECRFGYPLAQKPMTDITCLTCKKSLQVPKSDNGRTKYCSNWCRLHGKHYWTVGKKKDEIVICKRCGVGFLPTKPLQNYCSPKCASPNKVVHQINCRVCGKQYETLNKNSTICSMVCAGRSGVSGVPRKATISRSGFREDLGHKVRSSWEANVARWLVSKGYAYEYESHTFQFPNFSYTPDFYIPKLDLYIEVKGVWRKNSKQKLETFLVEHPNTWVIDRKEYGSLGFNPNLTKEYTIAQCTEMDGKIPFN